MWCAEWLLDLIHDCVCCLQELRIACSLAQQEREGGVSAFVSPMAQVSSASGFGSKGSAAGAAGAAVGSV